jgi:hypothetical protein
MQNNGNGNGNGHRKRPPGRPRLVPDESSVSVSVRFCESDFDWLDKCSKESHCTIPDILRTLPKLVHRYQRQMDHLLATQNISNEDLMTSFMRMLSAAAETASTQAAVARFLERWPDDPYVPSVHRIMDRFHEINALRPGFLTEADLWSMLQHGGAVLKLKPEL